MQSGLPNGAASLAMSPFPRASEQDSQTKGIGDVPRLYHPEADAVALLSRPTDSPDEEGSQKSQNQQAAGGKLSHEQKDRGLLILGAVKTLLGGVIVGGAVATVEKVKFWPMVGIDMLFGLGETLLAKWIIDSNTKPGNKILELSSRVSKAPDIPVAQMTHAEKEQALTPISVLVSGVSALATLGIADWLKERPWMKRAPLTKFDVDKSSGLSKSVKKLQVFLQELGHKVKAPAWLANNKLYKVTLGTKVGKVLLPAMAVGLLEGLVTQKLIKDEKKENSLYHKVLTLLHFQ